MKQNKISVIATMFFMSISAASAWALDTSKYTPFGEVLLLDFDGAENAAVTQAYAASPDNEVPSASSAYTITMQIKGNVTNIGSNFKMIDGNANPNSELILSTGAKYSGISIGHFFDPATVTDISSQTGFQFHQSRLNKCYNDAKLALSNPKKYALLFVPRKSFDVVNFSNGGRVRGLGSTSGNSLLFWSPVALRDCILYRK